MYTIVTYHKDTKTQSMAPVVKVHKYITLEAAKAAAEAIFRATRVVVGIEDDMHCECGSVLSAVTFTCVRGEYCPIT